MFRKFMRHYAHTDTVSDGVAIRQRCERLKAPLSPEHSCVDAQER